jgi:hypothetical protein
VAELADAHGSGPCTRKGVGVRVPSSAPVLFSNHLAVQYRDFAKQKRPGNNPGQNSVSAFQGGQYKLTQFNSDQRIQSCFDGEQSKSMPIN